MNVPRSAAPPLAIQLHTLREQAAADVHGVLARLGEVGFVGVEPARLHDLSPEEFGRAVQAAGMTVCSAHGPLPLGDQANAILDAQQAIGCEDHVVSFLPPERFATRAAVHRTADELNEAHRHMQRRGMRLGYHNHYWEFASLVDGQTAHSLLFELLEPEVFAEIDIYWVQVGGVDPASVLTELGPRARLLHVKDGPADGPKSAMTAVGDGVLDIPRILNAADAEWHIVELDRCDGNMWQAVESSYRYLAGEGLSRGRV